MTHGHPRTLLETSKFIAPMFTKPGFCSAIVVIIGSILTQDRYAVTQALVATGVAATCFRDLEQLLGANVDHVYTGEHNRL